jgi:hypothetical protein
VRIPFTCVDVIVVLSAIFLLKIVAVTWMMNKMNPMKEKMSESFTAMFSSCSHKIRGLYYPYKGGTSLGDVTFNEAPAIKPDPTHGWVWDKRYPLYNPLPQPPLELVDLMVECNLKSVGDVARSTRKEIKKFSLSEIVAAVKYLESHTLLDKAI